MSLKIDFCSRDAALFAVKRWHYSRSLPTPPAVYFGVWEDRKFIGVVIFSRGASASLFKPYGLRQNQGAELTRVALSSHKASVSRIIAICIKIIKKKFPSLRLLVSFADPGENHHGGIYQAGNWLYCGKSASSVAYFDKRGKKWHSRMVSNSGIKTVYGEQRRVLTPEQLKKVMQPGKHRYLMPLDAKIREQLEKLKQPYPKRGESSDSAAELPSSEGGASPTSPLQS